MLRVVLLASLVPAVSRAQPAAPPAPPEGVTFEVDAGIGWIRTSPETAPSYTTGVSVALDGGVGYWLAPRLAVSGRLAGLTNFESGERLAAYLIGPHVRYGLDDKLWVGGGIGLGVLLSSISPNDVGVGFDLRLGYTFSRREVYEIDASVEVTPTRFAQAGESAWLTGVSFLVGVHYL